MVNFCSLLCGQKIHGNDGLGRTYVFVDLCELHLFKNSLSKVDDCATIEKNVSFLTIGLIVNIRSLKQFREIIVKMMYK